jgi:ADP-L-glycero-D-manno-heptose 6-epimerase
MLVITGGAGFIGSNLALALNRVYHDDLVIVDDMTKASKVGNLAGVQLIDYVDKDDFRRALNAHEPWTKEIDAVFHQGACTSTTEPDGRYILRNNYDYSKDVLAFCQTRQIPLIYASSAAVYGGAQSFREDADRHDSLNVYGLSKVLFDMHVRHLLEHGAAAQIVGLRYFNVYGPREAHKGSMASLVMQLDDQLEADGSARLFGASGGFAAGEQRRDFVYVRDVVDVVLWFFAHPDKSGIFNCGSGQSRTFNALAQQVIRFRGGGRVDYIPFPKPLAGRYQNFTEADLSLLRGAGYAGDFSPIEQGIPEYLAWRRQTGEI